MKETRQATFERCAEDMIRLNRSYNDLAARRRQFTEKMDLEDEREFNAAFRRVLDKMKVRAQLKALHA